MISVTMVKRMAEPKMTPIAEEACIDRQIEEKVAKIVAGEVQAGDRREYNNLVLRRAHLVFQMGLSVGRGPVEYRRRVSGF